MTHLRRIAGEAGDCAEKEKANPISQTGLYLCRQRPTLPHTFACSTIGPAGLNLKRLEGVSALLLRAGAFCPNPERSLRRICCGGPS